MRLGGWCGDTIVRLGRGLLTGALGCGGSWIARGVGHGGGIKDLRLERGKRE